MTLPRRTLISLITALSLAFAASACDDGNTTNATPVEPTPDATSTPDEGGVADATTTPDEGTSTPDATSTPDGTATPEVTEPAQPDYPEGPYGYSVGDISPDISLYDPFTSEWIRFSDYYQRYDKRVLFVSSAAGWCGPCQLEAEELVNYYDQLEDDGLEPLYALYEDTTGAPTEIGSSATATFVQSWKDTFQVDYPLLIDPPRTPGDPSSFAIYPFYTDNAVPFAFMITTHDMKIRWKVHGYSPLNITYQILQNLEVANEWWNEKLASGN